MNQLFNLSVLAAALLVCPGCGESKIKKEAEAESKKLSVDAEYAKKMQGKMGGAAPAAAPPAGTPSK